MKEFLDAAKAIDTGKLLAKSFVAIIVAVTIGMIVDDALSSTSPSSLPEVTLPEPTAEGEVFNFTLFREVPYKHLRVTTGLKYPDARAAEPDHQYCYAIRLMDGGGTSLRLDLAMTDASGSVVYRTIAEADAQALGISARELKAVAKAFCRFIGSEAAGEVGDDA